jgi:hypothetical protein
MGRRASEDKQRQATEQASRRMIARGERPAYRLRMAQDGRWTLSEAPWLGVARASRREALTEAVRAISEWLDCDPASFDIAVDD